MRVAYAATLCGPDPAPPQLLYDRQHKTCSARVAVETRQLIASHSSFIFPSHKGGRRATESSRKYASPKTGSMQPPPTKDRQSDGVVGRGAACERAQWWHLWRGIHPAHGSVTCALRSPPEAIIWSMNPRRKRPQAQSPDGRSKGQRVPRLRVSSRSRSLWVGASWRHES